MRHLIPPTPGGGLDEVYAGLVLTAAPDGATRPTVALNMVTSVDGAVAVDGRSGPLGGAADDVAFPRLRAACDAVLVGAGTVRAEDYRPPHGDAARRAARVAAGLAPVPTLVIVSASLDLDPAARVFATRDGDPRPIVLTHDAASADAAERLAPVADVRRHGTDEVDLPAALVALLGDDLRRVLCEGGPTLNGALLSADLIDEVFLTVAPSLVGGEASRVASGPALSGPRPLDLVELHEHDGELLTRWRVRR